MAAVEQYTNRVIAQLDGGITNSATTLVVDSSTGAPTSGQFRALIGNEILLVTAITGLTWTIARGQESTTATVHSDNDPIYLIVTAESLLGLVRESHNGTNVGARRELNFVDGGGVVWSMTDDSTNRKVNIGATVANGFEASLVVPVLTDWTLYDPRTFGDAFQLGGAILVRGADGNYGTQEAHGIYRAVPATPWVATFRVRFFAYGADYSFGVVYFDSTPTKIASGLTFAVATGSQLCGHKWTDATTYSATYYTLNSAGFGLNQDMWYRLEDNGTNRITSISPDGAHWQVVHTVGRTDFLTCGKVGILVNPSGAGSFVTAILTSFSF